MYSKRTLDASMFLQVLVCRLSGHQWGLHTLPCDSGCQGCLGSKLLMCHSLQPAGAVSANGGCVCMASRVMTS